jgi:coenzyme PQQ precursor peptide PqqA
VQKQRWEKPEHKEVPLGAEVTAYLTQSKQRRPLAPPRGYGQTQRRA